jgi:hypothetical protein
MAVVASVERIGEHDGQTVELRGWQITLAARPAVRRE